MANNMCSIRSRLKDMVKSIKMESVQNDANIGDESPKAHAATPTSQSSLSFNNLNVSSDSSEENWKVNNILDGNPDKKRNYLSKKVPSAESIESRQRHSPANRGATTRKNHQGRMNNRSNQFHQHPFEPNRFSPSHTSSKASNRWNSTESLGHSTVRSNSSLTPNNKGKRPMRFRDHENNSDHGRNNGKTDIPFYYKVPHNPASKNILPPGTYLVIPQTQISEVALKVVYHPKAKNDKSENVDDNNSQNWKCGHERSAANKTNVDRSKQLFKKEKGTGGDQDDDEVPPVEVSKNESEQTPLSPKEVQYLLQLATQLQQPSTNANNEKSTNILSNPVPAAQNIESRRDEIKKTLAANLLHVTDEELEANSLALVDHHDEYINEFIRKKNNVEKQFQDLKSMLPDEDPVELRQCCESCDGDWEALLIVLENREKTMQEQEENRKIAEIYSMIPDADPTFIQGKIEEYGGDWTVINEFLFSLLESRNYPKVKPKDRKALEAEKIWKYYITDFTVRNYLDKLPNPETIFLGATDGKNTPKDELHAKASSDFLRYRYSDISEDEVQRIYIENGRSLTKTCLFLDGGKFCRYGIPSDLLNRNLSEEFIQEVSFIVHRNEIMKYLNDERERKYLEIRQAEEEGSFLVCDCCFDDHFVASDIVTCPECHIICKTCLTKYVQVEFSSGRINFVCVKDFCKEEYTLNMLEKTLNKSLLEKIIQKRAAEEIDRAQMTDLEKCPSCDYCYIPAPDDKIFKCENVQCLRETCRLCKEDNHIPLRCAEVERPRDVAARKKIEEAMSEKLIRFCPNCRTKFIKVDGCNKISCKCGTMSCYLCGKIVNDYSHFNNSRCPLYSNNEIVHVVEVERAGVQMREQALMENPDLHLVNDPVKNFRL